MDQVLHNRHTYRPLRPMMRRRVSQPIDYNSDTPEARAYQRKMKYWLDLLKSPDQYDVEFKATGRTPIFFVTMSHCSTQISAVLDKTPNINIQDKSGQTPLHVAVANNNLEAVRLIMTRKPDLCIRNVLGDTSLHVASATKNIRPEIVQEILRTRVCLNLKNDDGLTPLHIATIHNNIELMTDYLDLGAKTDITDNENRWTPLHHATMVRYSHAALLLLRRGANPNITDKFGQSPIFNAVMGGEVDLVSNMVKYGADIYIPNKFGQTPLHLAAQNPTSAVLRWFLDRNWNININVQNRKGQTPLHCAVEDNRSDNIVTILQKEPDLDLRDRQGLTVFDLRLDDELIKHVVKLKVAKLRVSQRTLNVVHTADNSGFTQKYEQQCYEELERMKKIPFPGLTVSYYQFTFTTLQHRAEYMMNKKLRLYPRDTTSIVRRFPIYWGTIDRCFFEAYERCRELEKFQHEKDMLFRGIPDHCVSNILTHLSTPDVRRLLKALKVPLR
ncbi:serine/threonine-protein phosphatase 6 regulatory ankyrin repeat subunit B-like [Chelonus insularis]|uniref:serine/threonine-protein phosphatase 6 regulatory ankyrin repeat subunit B-like n=1 Tax=Chelonus insularis TaxID=460826 RepID=UPI00158D3D8B|nr:serine/threonine-protein phosphatase 6 regulatory ankyrin repeat subunit B-like [Chelonus insularis]